MDTGKAMIQKIIWNRWTGAALMLIALVYTYWYLSFSNPFKSYGALSIIGLTHPVLFAVWGLLTETALYINIELAYRKTGYRSKCGRLLLNLAVTSIFITIFVPFDFERIFQYIIHCYGAISFIIYNGAAMLVLFFKYYRQKPFFILACITAVVLLTTLLLFLIIGESGVLECAPMLLSFIILFIFNTSNHFNIPKKELYKEKELIMR